MTQITLEDAQRRLPDLIAAALGGEDVVITGKDQPGVRLVPLVAEPNWPKFGSAKGQILIADDFDEPLEEFRE